MKRRAVTTFVLAALFVGSAVAAQADSDGVQRKRVSGAPHGKAGSAERYADRSGGVSNRVTITADDADGRGNRCTETWVDYRTKPHLHFNPGVLVNCSGRNRSVSDALTNESANVAGMDVVVCDVPDTSGPITRSRSNCRGALGAIALQSGKRYRQFEVSADQYPSGAQIYRA